MYWGSSSPTGPTPPQDNSPFFSLRWGLIRIWPRFHNKTYVCLNTSGQWQQTCPYTHFYVYIYIYTYMHTCTISACLFLVVFPNNIDFSPRLWNHREVQFPYVFLMLFFSMFCPRQPSTGCFFNVLTLATIEMAIWQSQQDHLGTVKYIQISQCEVFQGEFAIPSASCVENVATIRSIWG